MVLETMMEMSETATPYASQSAVAHTVTENMPREMSLVDRVRHVRITCGR